MDQCSSPLQWLQDGGGRTMKGTPKSATDASSISLHSWASHGPWHLEACKETSTKLESCIKLWQDFMQRDMLSGLLKNKWLLLAMRIKIKCPSLTDTKYCLWLSRLKGDLGFHSLSLLVSGPKATRCRCFQCQGRAHVKCEVHCWNPSLSI